MRRETEVEREKRNLVFGTTERAGALFWKMTGAPVPIECFQATGTPVPPGQVEAIARWDAGRGA